MGAAGGGYVECLKLLIGGGANVNAVNQSGRTALMGAGVCACVCVCARAGLLCVCLSLALNIYIYIYIYIYILVYCLIYIKTQDGWSLDRALIEPS